MSHQHHSGERPLWQTVDRVEPEIHRDHGGLPVQCQFCVGRSFRRSRLRFSDLSGLLLMHYPVRCTRCGQRQSASFIVAGAAIPSWVRGRGRSGSGGRHSSKVGQAPTNSAATIPAMHRHKAPGEDED